MIPKFVWEEARENCLLLLHPSTTPLVASYTPTSTPPFSGNVIPSPPAFLVRKLSSLKPRPNDRNMPTQHIATLLGAACCVRLATLLQHVATCWVLLAQIWPFSNLSQQHPTCRNSLQHGGQTDETCCAQQCCDMLRWHVAIVWPGLSNFLPREESWWIRLLQLARTWFSLGDFSRSNLRKLILDKRQVLSHNHHVWLCSRQAYRSPVCVSKTITTPVYFQRRMGIVRLVYTST